MAKDLNQCNFIGRLGKDVESRYMPNGKAVANFSIACSDDYKDANGNKVEQTNWINVVIFGRLAEVAEQYLRKGSQIFISGKQTTRKWQDKSGADRYTTEIVAHDLQMLGGKQINPKASTSADAQHEESSRTPTGGGEPDFNDDDIPF